MAEARRLSPGLATVDDPYACMDGADALVILTEWDQFRALDFDRVKSLLKTPVLIDLRNIYTPDEIAAAADLVRRKAEGVPVVVLRGLVYEADGSTGRDLLRPRDADLFRLGKGGLTTALVDAPVNFVAGVDARDLWRAQASVELVCGGGVRIRQARPRNRRAGIELQISADDDTLAGVAAGVLLAVLVDLGYGAVLVEPSPAPTVWAGRSALTS